jgi:molybdenum cofactor cytidylyltransferase
MISAVIPAAGLSQRMGTPKLLLPLAGKTIIEHVVDHVAAARVDEIIVVLGAVGPQIRSALKPRTVKYIPNPRYAEGMGTSVAAGAAAVHVETQWVLFINGDQPLVLPSLLDRLIDAADRAALTRTRLIRHPAKGPPILFHRELIGELIRLSGDCGGRRLIRDYAKQTLMIPTRPDDMILDVNTQADYRRLQALFQD